MLIQIFLVLLQLLDFAQSASQITATGTVINKSGYPLIGMLANLYQDSVRINSNSSQTLQDGTYKIQISTITSIISQQTNFQIEICYQSTELPCLKQSTKVQKVEENVYISKETITILSEFATVDSNLVLCSILATTLDEQSQILQKTITDFQIVYYKGTVAVSAAMTAISNSDGKQNFYIQMEKSQFYMLTYTSKHENYWDQHQNSLENPKYTLNAENYNKLSISIFFTKGHLQFTVKGILKQDLPPSPFQGELKIKLIATSTRDNIGEATLVSDINGAFEKEFDILIWNQIFIEIEVSKKFFEPLTKSIPQFFDSDKPQITKYQIDVGEIIMKRIRDLQISGKVIGVTGKAVPNLKLKIELLKKIKKEYEVTTDNNGQYKIVDIEIHENEELNILISYENLFNKQIITKDIYITTPAPSQQHMIPDIYYQQLTQAHITGKLVGKNVPVITEEHINIVCDSVDQNNKPISTTIITIKQQFELITQLLTEEDKTVKCTLVNGQQSQLKSYSVIADIKAPTYQAEIKIVVEYINTNFQVQGIITDLTKYTNFLASANIEINQNSQVLAKAITDAKGAFQIKVPVELHSKQTFTAKISSSGFIPITTPAVSVLIDVQNKVYELNEALDRNRIQIAIKDTLQDVQSHPFSKAQATLLKSDPTIKDSTYYGEKVQTDALGVLNAKFSCYENVDFIATFQIDIESYLPYSLPTPKSKCQNLDMGISKISPKKQEILLDISGKVIDPLMKPKPNLKMTLLILPTPISLTSNQLETNARGEWSVLQIKLEAESKYTISVSYLDGVSEQTKIDFTYTTTLSPQQSLVYQDIYFKDLETITIHGNIPTVEGLIPVRIPLNVVCQCEGKDKHSPTQAKILTNIDKTYQVEIQCVAQANIPIQCTFSKGDTTLINPFTQDVSTKAPSWSAEQNLKIEFVKFRTTFEGKVIDPYGKGKANFELLFTTVPQSIQKTTKSALDGVWQIEDGLFPQQQYEGIVTYVDVQNILQQKKNKFKLETNNQKIQFQQILYQDFVKAHLNGQIELKGCILKDEITLQLSCPQAMNREGIIQNNLKTEPSGKIDYLFEILVAYNDQVICTLKTINTFSIDPVAVLFKQPDFAANVKLETKLLFKSLVVDYILKDEQGQKVSNAVILVVVSPSIPCESVLECKTPESGECKISVNMVNQQKYIVVIKVQHPDFKEYSSNPVSLMFDKDQILSGTFILQRLIVTTILHAEIVDKNNNPIPSPIIKFMNLVPDIPMNDNKNKQVQANEKGCFDLNLDCYKNLHEILEIDVIFDVQSNIVKGLQFLCSGKQETLPNIQITYVPAKVQVEGQFINPWGKGQANLDLTLSTIPITKINKLRTDGDGKWNVLLFLQINVKYQLSVNYQDYLREFQIVTTDYQTQSELNQQFNFPTIYYINEVPIKISGGVKSALGFNVTYTDIYLSDSNGQLSKQQTNYLGEYEFKFTKIMKFIDIIQLTIKTAQSSKFLSGVVDFKIMAPKFKITKNIKVDETKKFKDLIKDYYKQVDITGIVVSDYNCKHNETDSNVRNRPVDKAIITLKKIEVDGSDLTLQKAKSNESGYFIIRVYIPKKQLSSPVFITIQKKEFRSTQVQAIIPYLYDMKQVDSVTQTTVIKIDLGYQLISLINSDKPCPFVNE